MDAIQQKILKRIRHGARGKVFTPKDFLDVGSRDAVDKALSRLAKVGDVQRLGRGLYHLSRSNPKLGIALVPDTDEIADALARQTGTRIAPSGATAANRLGLSTQVPAKPVYLTDGRSRRVRVGNYVLIVKHVTPKDLPGGSGLSVLVFQALRHLGKDAVNSKVIAQLRQQLSKKDRAKLLNDSRYTTDWVADAARRIADAEKQGATNG